MRYIVYDKNGQFQQSYSCDLGTDVALRYAKITARQVGGGKVTLQQGEKERIVSPTHNSVEE